MGQPPARTAVALDVVRSAWILLNQWCGVCVWGGSWPMSRRALLQRQKQQRLLQRVRRWRPGCTSSRGRAAFLDIILSGSSWRMGPPSRSSTSTRRDSIVGSFGLHAAPQLPACRCRLLLHADCCLHVASLPERPPARPPARRRHAAAADARSARLAAQRAKRHPPSGRRSIFTSARNSLSASRSRRAISWRRRSWRQRARVSTASSTWRAS